MSWLISDFGRRDELVEIHQAPRFVGTNGPTANWFRCIVLSHNTSFREQCRLYRIGVRALLFSRPVKPCRAPLSPSDRNLGRPRSRSTALLCLQNRRREGPFLFASPAVRSVHTVAPECFLRSLFTKNSHLKVYTAYACFQLYLKHRCRCVSISSWPNSRPSAFQSFEC